MIYDIPSISILLNTKKLFAKSDALLTDGRNGGGGSQNDSPLF